MKLTFWQQFSSNHSSLFYVVGEFATMNDAIIARNTLLDLYKEGMAAFDDNDAFMKTTYGQLVKDQYAIDVPLDHVTYVVGNLLIAEEHMDTWTYKPPVEALLEHVQAESITGYDEKTTEDDFEAIHLEVRFNAPDAAIAHQVDGTLSAYFASNIRDNALPAPWFALDVYFAQVRQSSGLLDWASIERLKQRWQDSFEVAQEVYGQKSPHVLKRNNLKTALMDKPKHYDRNGTAFEIEGMRFCEDLGFAAFIAWLEAQGCTDIYLRYG